MGIGTSMGAYYEDAFHQAAAGWDPKYDNNVIEPDTVPGDATVNDTNVIDPVVKTPDFITEVKGDMPFPDNRNPETDFDSRFPKDMKSGILNDLKPRDTVPKLTRKIGYKTAAGPGFEITDEDIDKGIGLALAFSGGGSKVVAGEKEAVKSAALQYKGKTYEGANHGYALGDIMDAHGSNINMKDIKDGFTTTQGKFISREEAFQLAKKNEQIKDSVLPALDENSSMLLSEDLKGF